MKALDAAVLTLATARLATLIAEDEVTQPLRAKVFEWSEGAEYGSFKERVTYLATCTRCTSIWAAGIVLALWANTATRPVVRLLAFSQGAIGLTDLLRLAQN